MKHKVGYNRLSRKAGHRKAMLRNMAISLFQFERIKTTKAKAKEVRRCAEKMITRAKTDSVHNRRIIARDIHDKAVLSKLFVEIAPRYTSRPGGYTRIVKLGSRQGDGAAMVLLELVDRVIKERKRREKTESAKEEPAEDESE
jgi:large subunit ribosomal protein L17